MKVTVVKQKEPKNSIALPIFLLILGIVLTFHANGFLHIIFICIGVCIILSGIFEFFKWQQLKKEVDHSQMMVSSISYMVIGFLFILLSSIFVDAIQMMTGIIFLFIGLYKLNYAFSFKKMDKNRFLALLISSILFFGLGIYTIFAQNALFLIIGILLIIYSIFSIIDYFLK